MTLQSSEAHVPLYKEISGFWILVFYSRHQRDAAYASYTLKFAKSFLI